MSMFLSIIIRVAAVAIAAVALFTSEWRFLHDDSGDAQPEETTWTDPEKLKLALIVLALAMAEVITPLFHGNVAGAIIGGVSGAAVLLAIIVVAWKDAYFGVSSWRDLIAPLIFAAVSSLVVATGFAAVADVTSSHALGAFLGVLAGVIFVLTVGFELITFIKYKLDHLEEQENDGAEEALESLDETVEIVEPVADEEYDPQK